VATQINLDAAEAISGIYSLLFRGVVVDGRLYRPTVTLLADEGVDLTFQVHSPAVHGESCAMPRTGLSNSERRPYDTLRAHRKLPNHLACSLQ
jgi:hypothetical protein